MGEQSRAAEVGQRLKVKTDKKSRHLLDGKGQFLKLSVDVLPGLGWLVPPVAGWRPAWPLEPALVGRSLGLRTRVPIPRLLLLTLGGGCRALFGGSSLLVLGHMFGFG